MEIICRITAVKQGLEQLQLDGANHGPVNWLQIGEIEKATAVTQYSQVTSKTGL